MKKLTKADIENMAKEIRQVASKYRLGNDWSLFYNGKMFTHECVSKPTADNPYHHVYKRVIKENVDPHNYSEWFSDAFIMGMAYDGTMYEVINYGEHPAAYAALERVAEKYNTYMEPCDSCHLEFAWNGNDIEEVEYTLFVKEKPKWLYRCSDAPDESIAEVMRRQYELATEVGDVGACTIGEHIEFRYKGTLYRMSMQTPYQGDWSWRETIPEVKRLLELRGATEIHVDYGRLD